jgi:hypothetical protein
MSRLAGHVWFVTGYRLLCYYDFWIETGRVRDKYSDCIQTACIQTAFDI